MVRSEIHRYHWKTTITLSKTNDDLLSITSPIIKFSEILIEFLHFSFRTLNFKLSAIPSLFCLGIRYTEWPTWFINAEPVSMGHLWVPWFNNVEGNVLNKINPVACINVIWKKINILLRSSTVNQRTCHWISKKYAHPFAGWVLKI